MRFATGWIERAALCQYSGPRRDDRAHASSHKPECELTGCGARSMVPDRHQCRCDQLYRCLDRMARFAIGWRVGWQLVEGGLERENRAGTDLECFKTAGLVEAIDVPSARPKSDSGSVAPLPASVAVGSSDTAEDHRRRCGGRTMSRTAPPAVQMFTRSVLLSSRTLRQAPRDLVLRPCARARICAA